MGRAVIRQTPTPMPTAEELSQAFGQLPYTLYVAGCRGTSEENDSPGSVHMEPRGWYPDDETVEGKSVVIFIHGYNVTTRESLASCAEVFDKLHASLLRDGRAVDDHCYVPFLWPGDVGSLYFNDAQQYASRSSVAFQRFLKRLIQCCPLRVSIITHSLGAQVALGALTMLGMDNTRKPEKYRINSLLALGPAIEDDAFERATSSAEYHFTESAFAIENLHIGISRDDQVLGAAFHLNEQDRAMGFNGPQSMQTFKSLARRVKEVLGSEVDFRFAVHDFSVNSQQYWNPELEVRGHADYVRNQTQFDFYVNLI